MRSNLMNELLQMFKAVSDKNRLRILRILKEKSFCVSELAEVINITQSSVSRHLKQLKNVGLIEDEKDGQWVNYKLSENGKHDYGEFIISNLDKWLKEEDSIIKTDMERTREVDRRFLINNYR